MSSRIDSSRRKILVAGIAGAFTAASGVLPSFAQTSAQAIATRKIPHSGEALPIIGLGTAINFDFADDAARYGALRQVLQAFITAGARVIDSAHSYGRAEDRLGELVADLGARERLFIATKYSYAAERDAASASMQASLRRLKTQRIDLMQAWNVANPAFDFGLLREWKQQGLCRYIGMTTSFRRQYDAVAKVLAREKPDFFQVNYSLGDREAESELLPIARDAGAAVLINLPFGRNSLFRKAANRPLPDFAREFGATSWAQFFLKFILSHPAVTVVIPGTSRPEHMLDNLQAGRGPMPDAAMRSRIVEYWEAL
ncbi:MAG: aldo/keto reductase [Burkholderiales bacterium]|nr:aldo/keto reductase [Burkholderiales bacterium]